MVKTNWDDPLPPAAWEHPENTDDRWEQKLIESRSRDNNGILIGKSAVTELSLHISPAVLSTHMQIVGASGVGKSFFLEGLLKQLILQGHGLCLIDPHGDLYIRIVEFCAYLDYMQPERKLSKRVIPVDIGNREQILAFNPVARNARVMTFQVVALMEVIRKCWGAGSFQETPRLARWLFNAAYALIDSNVTLVQMQDMLSPVPTEIQSAVIKQIKNPRIKVEWEWLASLKPERRGEYTESSFNRTREFGLHEVMKLVLGQYTNTIDFPSILNEQKILLVNLAGQNTITDDDKHLLGTLLVNELITAAFARPQGKRKPCFLAIDEFQHFVTKDICEILDGGRKFGLHLILAHQHLNQLKIKDPEVYYSTLTNARTKVVFGGMNDEDLEILSKELYTGELNPDEIKDEVWQTKLRPVESTRTIRSSSWSETISESDSESSSDSSSDGTVSHSSIANGESYIPGSGLWSGSQLQATNNSASIATGSNYSHSSSNSRSSSYSTSTSSGTSEAEVPWYEYHEYKELSSRTFRSLEEQLYIKKAQLKRQPRQHATLLIPDSAVQLIKTGTLKDFSKLISYSQQEKFINKCFEQSKCFKSATAAAQEVAGLEEKLLQPQPTTIDVTAETSTSEAEAAGPGKKRTKTKVTKKKQQEVNIFDSVLDDIINDK